MAHSSGADFPESSHSHQGFSLAFPIHSLTTLRENRSPGDDFRKTTLSVPKPDGRPFGTAREPTGTGGQTAQTRGSLSVLSLEGPSPARGTVSWSPVEVAVQTDQVQERAGGMPPSGPPPPGGGVKGLCSSRICTTPENPATSTRLTKDTRGLRGGCDARGCYRGMDECTLRSRAEQEGSGPASPGRRRACVRRDNGSELGERERERQAL